MQISVGYELRYTLPQATSMILTLNVHHSRVSDLVRPDHVLTEPALPVRQYRDSFGNWCTRLWAPAGTLRIWADTIVNDSGEQDRFAPWAPQIPPEG